MKIKLSEIQEFLNQKNIAVAGVSRNEKKFGNEIYKELKNKGYNVFPVNPNISEFKGEKCYAKIEDLPAEVTAILTCTKPAETEKIVQQAIQKGIKHIWLQQGSQSDKAIELAKQPDVNVIFKKCIFMFLEPVAGPHKFHRFFVKLFGSYPKN